jgi:hypothetical protein
MADTSSSGAAVSGNAGGATAAPLNDAVRRRLEAAAARGDAAAAVAELSAPGADVTTVWAALEVLAYLDYSVADDGAMNPSAAPVTQAVMAALRLHAGDAAVQAAGLCVLSLVAAEAQGIVADAGAMAVAVAAMRTHADVKTQSTGAAVLLLLVQSAAHAKAMSRHGVVDVTVQALRMHPASEQMHRIGCRLLMLLVNEVPENQRMAAAAGGVELMVDALRTHGADAEIVGYACSAFCMLTAFNPENVARAGRAGAAAALVQIMRAHASVLRVLQRYALGALQNLLCVTPNRPACIAAGGTEATLAALRAHPSDFVLHVHGWPAIEMLTIGNKHAAGTAARLGAVDMAFAALLAFAEDAVVVQHACSAVRVMLAAAGAVEVTAGAATAVLDVLRLHQDVPDTVAAVLGALAMLARIRCLRQGAEAVRARDAVLRALQAHGTHADVQKSGLFALTMTALVASCDDRQHARTAMRLTLDVMRCHATNVELQLLGVSVLNRLRIVDAANAADACQLGAMSVVTAALHLRADKEPGEHAALLHQESEELLRNLRAVPRPATASPSAAHHGACAFPGCSPDGSAAADQPLRRCSGCRAASYCCEAHQRADWARHRPECLAARAAEVRI